MPNRDLAFAVGKVEVVAGEFGFPFTLGSSSGSIISDGRTSADDGANSEASMSMTSAAGAWDGCGDLVVLRFFEGLSSSKCTISSTSPADLEELGKRGDWLEVPLIAGVGISSSDTSSTRGESSSSRGGLDRLLPFGTVASMISRAVNSSSFSFGFSALLAAGRGRLGAGFLGGGLTGLAV